MKQQMRSSTEKRSPNYSRVLVSTLKKSRKGKHHDLILGIMEDLRGLKPGFAVKIPFANTDGVPALNLRSAITRAAAKEDIHIATASDEQNFYVWRM
jgi:hypothetical protein